MTDSQKTASPPIVEIRDVDQSFRVGFWLKPVQVLHGISLDIPKGSIFGFLGANGAGKTTLIHLITGLRKPSRGKILVGGHDARDPAARARLGYLPERPYFHEHLTGEGTLSYFGSLSGMSPERIRARIPEVLRLVGLAEAGKTELRKYSKGMLQRIGIGQALLHSPELLILDEPMSGLDPIGRKDIRELIVRLAAEGHTVFFSSHVIPDVEAICDQVALIQKGRLIGCGPIGQFLSHGAVHTEVAFSGVELERARAFGSFESLRAIPDGVRGVLGSQQDVQQVLRGILAEEGARVLWVSPIRQSLESLFTGGSES